MLRRGTGVGSGDLAGPSAQPHRTLQVCSPRLKGSREKAQDCFNARHTSEAQWRQASGLVAASLVAAGPSAARRGKTTGRPDLPP
jgi:hypothetical protein